jgi:hypothetical protein
MKKANLFMEMVATYRKHGWELRSALMQPATLAELRSQEAQLLNRVDVRSSSSSRGGEIELGLVILSTDHP